MSRQSFSQEQVQIRCGKFDLMGVLSLVEGPKKGLILFAHGSGSGRLSPRNQFVSERLLRSGLDTLLFDLLTEEEEIIEIETRHLRFDIPLLARRLVLASEWSMQYPRTTELPLAYFGASTGAAAALVAATSLGDKIGAIVSRGGRPDLADEYLPRVCAPTLLIVGGHDSHVLELNRDAMTHMRPGMAHLEVIPGATHLFEEAGALTKVADLAISWLHSHLRQQTHGRMR